MKQPQTRFAENQLFKCCTHFIFHINSVLLHWPGPLSGICLRCEVKQNGLHSLWTCYFAQKCVISKKIVRVVALRDPICRGPSTMFLL